MMDRVPMLFILTLYLTTIFECYGQKSGCTDPLAKNYDGNAIINDGSCYYAETGISPTLSFELDSFIDESSGLIIMNNTLYTHNDHTTTTLYAIDSINGKVTDSIAYDFIVAEDWEEVSQDNDFIYIGDFGNNNTGVRQNLRIFKINKTSQLVDTISFSYPDQIDFSNPGGHNTDYDCESMVITNDSIFLFTKQWINNGTTVYSVPNTKGNYIAERIESYDIDGLITGACYLPNKNVVVLAGYTFLVKPFLYLLYDYHNNRFFSGNKRRIEINYPFLQIEGIATSDGLHYFITNELLDYVGPIPAQLHHINLEPFLKPYLYNLPYQSTIEKIFPNPFDDHINIKSSGIFADCNYTIYDMSGRKINNDYIVPGDCTINTSNLLAGYYIIKISGSDSKTMKLLKLKR